MLIALITILLLGGGDSAVLDFVSYMRDSVDEVVADDERRKDATATLKEMKKLTNTHLKANGKAFKALLGEVSELETDVAATEAIWSDYNRATESYNQQMIDLRFKLRDSLTRSEWERIFVEPGD